MVQLLISKIQIFINNKYGYKWIAHMKKSNQYYLLGKYDKNLLRAITEKLEDNL